MKKILTTLLGLLLLTGASFAQVSAKDGVYFAEDQTYAETGWKEQVVVKVAGGKIVAVNYNGVSNLGIQDKKTVAAAGGYGMIKASKIKLEWHQQAQNLEKYLLQTQDVAFAKIKADGTTDAITGATFHVGNFFKLLKKALASAPVPKGVYAKDGWFFAEQPEFDARTGWKDNVLITVVNGTVVDAVWNAVNNDTKLKSKLIEAIAGRYGLAKVSKIGEWNVQAEKVEAALVKVQDPAKIPVKADGTTDAISGATIHVTAVSLAARALQAAR